MKGLVTRLVLATTASTLVTDCGARRPSSPPIDTAAAYVAILRAPQVLRTGRGVALGTQRMSDSGTYEASGSLSPTIVDRLVRVGLVQEVCTEAYTRDSVPDCKPRRVGNEVRVSRLVPLGHSEFDVYVGQGTVRLPGDSLYLPFATTHRCRLVWAQSTWTVRRCDLYMIT